MTHAFPILVTSGVWVACSGRHPELTVSAVTFGAPNVGDKELVDWVEQRVNLRRIEYLGDKPGGPSNRLMKGWGDIIPQVLLACQDSDGMPCTSAWAAAARPYTPLSSAAPQKVLCLFVCLLCQCHQSVSRLRPDIGVQGGGEGLQVCQLRWRGALLLGGPRPQRRAVGEQRWDQTHGPAEHHELRRLARVLLLLLAQPGLHLAVCLFLDVCIFLYLPVQLCAAILC